MSKRDTFERNVKALTRTRSLAAAIRGWEIVDDISLRNDGPRQACELCGTHFCSGAWIKRAGVGSRKPVQIPVGGTCLSTILRGSFGNLKAVERRSAEIRSRLHHAYGDLVDPGSWIKWLIEHVPTRLRPLAARLKYQGTVATDRDLNRLIKFHDATRKFPVASLLPISHGEARAFALPSHLTLDEARMFLRNITSDGVRRIVASRSKDFRVTEIDAALPQDDQWSAAWKKLDRRGRRAVTALAKLSDQTDQIPPKAIAILQRLPPIPSTPVVPFFVWYKPKGLALIEELSDEVEDEATAWLWEDDSPRIDLTACRIIEVKSESDVLALEMAAFWPLFWYQSLPHNRPNVPAEWERHAKHARPKTKRPVDQHEYEAIRHLPCIAQFLDIARFKGNRTIPHQFSWLQREIPKVGCEWSDFIWAAERYSTSSDCKERIDRIRQKLMQTWVN